MDHLETEARNPASANLDELSSLEIVRLMNAEDARVAAAVATQGDSIARAIDIIAERIGAGGRLIYVGAGTSGRLGVLDATECPPTFNAPPGQVVGVIAGGPAAVTSSVEGAEDHPEFGERDLAAIALSSRDVLVGIATSGRTPYVLGALAYARRIGAFTIGLSCNADSDLIPEVDMAITPVVGPEVLSGSTRLKAGTATKMVLNMLSTGAMVRLGKVYGNLMVDLRATNNKLRARTNRIVRLLTGLDHSAADALLARCDNELKTALVASLANIPPNVARERLAAAGGLVRAALVGHAVHATVTPTGADIHVAATHGGPCDDLVLGIDGGGTHTIALLAKQLANQPGKWALLGRGQSGPSNFQAIGLARAFAALDEAIIRAFAAAGLPRQTVHAACLGLAGAGRADDQETIRRWALDQRISSDVQVTADVSLVLAAGTPDGWGVALIAGTGSMAFARSPDGRTTRAGGWGYILGDEGSGYALGLAALQAVAQAADGRGPPTRLTASLLDRLQLTEPQQLIAAVYQQGLDRAAISSLAPLALAAAEHNDHVADQIVHFGAEQLAVAIAACCRELALPSPFPLAMAGGVLLGSADYRERVLQAAKRTGTTVGEAALVSEPAEGALSIAVSSLCQRQNSAHPISGNS